MMFQHSGIDRCRLDEFDDVRERVEIERDRIDVRSIASTQVVPEPPNGSSMGFLSTRFAWDG